MLKEACLQKDNPGKLASLVVSGFEVRVSGMKGSGFDVQGRVSMNAAACWG